MVNSTEKKMMEFMRPLFGDMARKTIENQKEKLNLTKGELTYEQYVLIVESIRNLCFKMAGGAVAEKLRHGLMQIVEAERA
jgi:hypothetical protein